MRIRIGQWSDGSFWSSGYGYWILDSTKLEDDKERSLVRCNFRSSGYGFWILDSTKLEDDKERSEGSFWSWMKPSWSILEPPVL